MIGLLNLTWTICQLYITSLLDFDAWNANYRQAAKINVNIY